MSHGEAIVAGGIHIFLARGHNSKLTELVSSLDKPFNHDIINESKSSFINILAHTSVMLQNNNH